MNARHETGLPTLIVITGRPASGKTTLARALGYELGCPVLSRDEIMEGLLLSIDDGSTVAGDAKRHTYDVFFDTIESLLRNNVTLVAEAAFQHTLWAPRLAPLRERARIKILRCSIDVQLANSRFLQRTRDGSARKRVHAVGPGKLPASDHAPLTLPVATLDVDTSDGYDPSLDEIVAFAQS